jgi:glucose/arabinose dehydrogenase
MAALPTAAVAAVLLALTGSPAVVATTRNLDLAERAAVITAAPAIGLSLLVGGLSQPVFVTSARDGSGRLFIVEKTGRIRIWKNGALNATPFLNIATLVSGGSEQGLLGLAFPSNYATTHKLYVNFTRGDGDTIVAEYRSGTTGNPDVVDPKTRRTLLHIYQPYDNHNGGMLAFGRDGYLYVGLGDGGSGGDPGNRGQSLATLLGKLLRIDPSATSATKPYRIPASNPYVGRSGLDEIWDYGLRNPWRFSFDRANGNLWIGDVGQNAWEEVDRATWISSTHPAGRGNNWGWRVMEGRHCYSPPSGCNTTGKTLPPVEYSHANGRCAVTGGYVYRGTAIPALVGTYVFGDYCSGEVWYTTATSTAAAPKTLLLDTSYLVSSFGEDQAGELYLCDLNGAVYKVVPA